MVRTLKMSELPVSQYSPVYYRDSAALMGFSKDGLIYIFPATNEAIIIEYGEIALYLVSGLGRDVSEPEQVTEPVVLPPRKRVMNPQYTGGVT